MASEATPQKRKRDDEPKPKHKPKPKNEFIYGNYRNYYGYRIGQDHQEDPRLSVFKREWFQGKDCLDIGCNQGLITIRIAEKFCCRSILGIDIDASLIEAAYCNLRNIARKISRTGDANRKMMKSSKSEVPNETNCLEHGASQGSNEDMCNSPSSDCIPGNENLLQRVSFRKENFVESLHGCSEKYDTILCLSVTKWIHLNWGDDGLITLFVKIWKLLRPGGIFLLEPQPWSSYQKNRQVSKTAKTNFNEIHLRPDVFRDILLDKVGFRSAETITDNLSGTVAGFNRPILALFK